MLVKARHARSPSYHCLGGARLMDFCLRVLLAVNDVSDLICHHAQLKNIFPDVIRLVTRSTHMNLFHEIRVVLRHISSLHRNHLSVNLVMQVIRTMASLTCYLPAAPMRAFLFELLIYLKLSHLRFCREIV